MPTTRITHDFECSEETFWKICFFDEEFSRRLYLEELKFPSWKILEQKTSGDWVERKVAIEPRVDSVPAPIKKIMGDRFGYVEEGKFDRVKKRYSFRIIPSAMPDKTEISGEMYCEPLGPNRVRRTVDFQVEVKIFVVGKLIEQKSIDDTKASYETMASFLRAYLREKGLS